jgi:hypothetical protein
MEPQSFGDARLVKRYLQMNRLAEVRAIARVCRKQAFQTKAFERRKQAGYANVKNKKRLPHSHSLDGGYGLKSNAKPRLNQRPS